MHDVARPVKERNANRRFTSFFGRHPILSGVVALVLLFLVLAGIKAMQIRKMMSMPMVMPPTTVSSVQVKLEDWPPIFSSIGTVSAVQGATVSAELAGTVAEVKFENGGIAKKGDVLMRLDTSSEDAQM